MDDRTKEPDAMMPRVGETLTEYTARHLGIDVQHFRDMKDNTREERYGDKLGELAFEYSQWKDGIRSKLRVPKNSAELTIEQVIHLYNPTRIPKSGPKALEPLPGQTELFPESPATT